MNKITRSTVNEQQYSAPELPKSGFPLSYRKYSSYMLGRMHVAGYQWCMPGDKISGRCYSGNSGCTFKNIVTPIISPVNAMQYNIYLPLRPLDRSFKKGITPTKLNAMSANWSMPTFNTRYLVDQVLRALYNVSYNTAVSQSATPALYWLGVLFDYNIQDTTHVNTLNDFVTNYNGLGSLNDWLYDTQSLGVITSVVNNLTTDGSIIATMADNLYARDLLIDIADNITAKLGDSDNPLNGSMLVCDFVNLYLTCLLEPFVGRYSYYGEFDYLFVSPADFYRISHGFVGTTTGVTNYDDLLSVFSKTPQNEYAIRAMYAVWYELFRNVDLEPVGPNLPDWQEWSSTSIFDMSAGGNLLYLVYRARPWEKDMFISAQIDDMSRHVYAPVVNGYDTSIAGHSERINNLDTNVDMDSANFQGGSKPSLYTLYYQDQLSNSNVSIECPVPSNVNDVISALDISFVDVYGLDLNTLRQSQALERYLKRNYLFGDEYQDRMLAHYNSRVSDLRINKPEVLSRSMDGYDMQQEVSNVSTSAGTQVGDRTATATIPVNGEEYTTFCEEFGIVISLVTFMPRAMYKGVCPQNLMSKQVHLPIPEFAANNEEFGRKLEISSSGLATGYLGDDQNNQFMFGRYPAYHAWRSRVDEVGGMFLDELQDATFRRFWGNFSDDTTPKLNYFFIHCRPNLSMFADTVAYNTQIYGDIINDCYVERVLPTPLEVI